MWLRQTVLTVAVATLIVSACGGESDETSNPADVTTTDSAATVTLTEKQARRGFVRDCTKLNTTSFCRCSYEEWRQRFASAEEMLAFLLRGDEEIEPIADEVTAACEETDEAVRSCVNRELEKRLPPEVFEALESGELPQPTRSLGSALKAAKNACQSDR